MIHNCLLFVSHVSVFLGIFFIIASFIGFVRYDDFYTKLHSINMFNIYGIGFVLFAMAILTFDPIIFFEMISVLILNAISSIAIVSALLRSAILNGVQYDAKTREEVLKMREEEKSRIEAEEESLGINRYNEEESSGYKSRTTKSSVENMDDNIEEEKKKKKKKKKKTDDEMDDIRNLPGSSIETSSLIESEDDRLKKEEEELKQKIKEQKRILRNKIAKARKDAFITRKKEEIERVEKEIHDLLAKHDLTEEDLKDDDDDNNNSQSSATGSYTTTQTNQ